MRANKGAPGIDGMEVGDFPAFCRKHWEEIRAKLEDGSYQPSPVKRVYLPKPDGSQRELGIPTVSDRIAQMVVKLVMEPLVEPHFYPDSYGYRPGKSALDAVGVTRKRCWRQDWVVDLDVKAFFDNLDHNLAMRAVKHHVKEPWILLYIERWLKAPVEREDGTQEQRSKGTPQGSVISPLLANLFMHYAFDDWLRRKRPGTQFARFADDAVVRGWINYYGRYYPSALKLVLRQVDRALAYWVRRKYKRYARHRRRAMHWLGRVARRSPGLFAHWEAGVRPAAGS